MDKNHDKDELLFNFVRQHTTVSRAKLLSPVRKKDYVFARMLFIYIAYEKLFYTFKHIGRMLNRDHSSVQYLYKKSDNNDKIKGLFNIFDSKNIKNNAFDDILKGRLEHRNHPPIYRKMYDKAAGKCMVCGFSAYVEICHIIPRRLGGPLTEDNLLVLCPNHHKMFDNGLLMIKDINSNPHYPHP